jgi:peptidyl-prolyl cis-trans isomerase A (cyclophilin A)
LEYKKNLPICIMPGLIKIQDDKKEEEVLILKRTVIALIVMVAFTCSAYAAEAPKAAKREGKNPIVLVNTSMGNIKLELFEKEAPISVKNFLGYVNSGFYSGTIFHRVIPNFMVQGGGFTTDFVEKPTNAPIKNEAGNGLKNERGTLAMARTFMIDSATAQFFINVKDNSFLNHSSNTMQGFGYAVFGRVIEGMDVVDKIAAVPTGNKGEFSDVPVKEVVIKSVKVIK